MKVGEYRVKWTYKKAKPNSKVITTVCIIFNKTGEIISTGFTLKTKNDEFNKDTGRRLSLKRALEERKEIFSKYKRGEFWEEYRLMTKAPRWILKIN